MTTLTSGQLSHCSQFCEEALNGSVE